MREGFGWKHVCVDARIFGSSMLARVRHVVSLSFAALVAAANARAQDLPSSSADAWPPDRPEILDPWAGGSQTIVWPSDPEVLDPWQPARRAPPPLPEVEIVDPWQSDRAPEPAVRFGMEEIVDPWQKTRSGVPTAAFPALDERELLPSR